MAKQSGLHQIRGKVGEHSYYRQSGVTPGLIRSINQGMSARVKNGGEYANTRLNNAEFKNANGIATFALNAVPNRKSSMLRRFAIAEMTKKGLEYIKDGSGNWGVRIPSATMDQIIADLLENRAKSGVYQGEYGTISLSTSAQGAVTINGATDEATVQALVDKGIDGFYTLVVKGAAAEVVDADGFVRQHFGVSSISPSDHIVDPEDAASSDWSATFTPSYSTLGMSPAGYAAAADAPNNGMFAIVTFLPFRTVGNQRHSLYEYATFAALPLGAIPTE